LGQVYLLRVVPEGPESTFGEIRAWPPPNGRNRPIAVVQSDAYGKEGSRLRISFARKSPALLSEGAGAE